MVFNRGAQVRVPKHSGSKDRLCLPLAAVHGLRVVSFAPSVRVPIDLQTSNSKLIRLRFHLEMLLTALPRSCHWTRPVAEHGETDWWYGTDWSGVASHLGRRSGALKEPLLISQQTSETRLRVEYRSLCCPGVEWVKVPCT